MKRFWDKVNKTDTCWEWTARLNYWGYGTFKVGGKKGKSWLSHRWSWKLNVGPIPNGLCVLHTCDNPKCVRPEHLFLGTNKDNSVDKVRKNRQARLHGSKSGRAKLTEHQVIEIRRLYSENSHTFESLALLFNVSDSCIDFIINRKTWKHV